MKSHARQCLGVVSVLILAMPVWAAKSSSHKDSTDYDVTRVTMIGNTQLQPGHYTIKATESENQLDILENGKVVATVPCHWVKLPEKAGQSEIETNNNRVDEVEFQGRAEAAKIG